MSVACQEDYGPLPEAFSKAKEISKVTGSVIEIMRSSSDAIQNTNLVVTDTFVSMGEGEKPERL